MESVSEVTEVSTPASPAVEGGEAQGSPQQKGPAEAGAKEGDAASPVVNASETTPPPFTPRGKFKVMVLGSDEQKEHDVPELLKSVMKDADAEKQVIELLEKAYGLEPVKASRTQIRQERDDLKKENTLYKSSIDEVKTLYQKGDIDLFLDKLAIPHERMLQWALEKVNYSQLPPEQQKIMDERREATRRAYSAEQQSEQFKQQYFEQARQAKAMQLESSLARPDVRSFVDAFDAKVGKPGAFRAEVASVGEYAWLQSGGKVDLTPDQAIEQALGKWRNFVASPSTPGATPATGEGETKVIAPPAKPTTIPNVQGRSHSPLKSQPRSIEDLKKLRDAAPAN